MKKHLGIFILLFITCIKTYSQIKFESGYFINNSNQRIECQIKNVDWKDNPTKFEYTLLPKTAIQKASIDTVKEFGINGVAKFIRANVKIDRSSDDLNSMSPDMNPSFQEEQLFLKVLVEGKASLYFYENGNLKRFFFAMDDLAISQLIYKQYLIEDKVNQNTYFRQQLFANLKCEAITMKDIENIEYTQKDLESLFVKYNKCKNVNSISYQSKQKRNKFQLTLRPGLNVNNLVIQNSTTFGTDFGSNAGVRLGAEAEFILPYNKNKWGIIIEPTYQYFKSQKSKETNTVSGGVLVTKVNYQSVELPVGLRHSFYLNDDSKIFANISYVFDFSMNSSVESSRSDGSIINSIAIKSRPNIAFGAGYKYLDRYSIEIRYQTSREILSNYVFWKSSYKTLSIIFGYSIFKNH